MAETFNWGGQPITFSPPGEGWERSRDQNGGQEGIAFTKTKGKGTGISIVEVFALGNRDKCAEFEKLRDDQFETWKQAKFLTELQRADLFISPVLYENELGVAKAANANLDIAKKAYMAKNHQGTRDAITQALNLATNIVYTLDHVNDRVTKEQESKKEYPKSEVSDLAATSVGDFPATAFDYKFYEDWRKTDFNGRQVFVVVNNRLFKAAYIGLEGDLGLFDSVVSSIAFPEGDCRH